MLTNEELKEFTKKITNYMRKPEAQNFKMVLDLKELSNIYHSLIVIKENGNYGMLEAAIAQFQFSLQQIRQDVKSEIKQKLRELILDFSQSLDVIAENLDDLETGTLDIFKTMSKLYLCVQKMFNLKDLITSSSYPKPPPLLPS